MKKYSLKIIMAVFIFIAMLPQQALAAGNENPSRLQADQSASIEAELSQANGEKISSLQLDVEVTDQSGNPVSNSILENIEKLVFSPDTAVASKATICEQRYHNNTGILNIYIAGTEPLFSAEDKLTVGTVTATGKDGKNIDIYIRVAEGSFKVVKGNILQTITEEDEAVIRIVTAQEETPTKPEVPTTPQEPETPAQSQEPTIDKTQLNAALDIAAGFVEKDYTADSFALLKAAIEKAKAVVNNPDVTQQEVETITEELLNVIGSLVPALNTSVDNNGAQTGGQNNQNNQNSESAKTGDWSSVWIFMVMTVLSLAVIVVLVIWKKYHKQLQK